MLPKANRLKTTKDFDLVYKQGKKFYSHSFLLIIRQVQHATPQAGISYPRIGFVASKKVGGAVDRNHAKRVLREIVRSEFPSLKHDFEAVLIASQNLLTLEYASLKQEVIDALKKAGLYRNS